MTDRIVLAGLAFMARHGVHEDEKTTPQRFEVDVELELDLGPAGRSDDLTATVDYGDVAKLAREVLEGPPVGLIDTLAERIAARLLERFPPADAVVVRVRKPDVQLGAPVAYAGVEIRRVR
jgi:dihydroneopterin aldolase